MAGGISRAATRPGARDIFGALATLGERIYSEALCLCDSEQEAAALASAHLVRSLEEDRRVTRRTSVRPRC